MRPDEIRALDQLDPRVRLTAAIAGHFDPLSLFDPAGGSLVDLAPDVASAVDGLAAVCEEVDVGTDYRHWTMQSDARRAVLRSLQSNGQLDRLLDDIEIAPTDRFGTYLQAGLSGADLSAALPDAAPPDPRPSDGGHATTVDGDSLLRAARFVDDLRASDETRRAERLVRLRLAVVDADRALSAAMPDRLIGRVREYDRLLAYLRTDLSTDGTAVPTFVLTGPGGVGKSALVSQFVHDRRKANDTGPVIYLDFDRAVLADPTSLDLTHELTRQLAHRDPALDRDMKEFRARTRASLGREGFDVDGSAGTSVRAMHDLGSLLADRLSGPVTVVLDTFEEVAIRGLTPVMDVLDWLVELRDVVGLRRLHAIISGREVRPDAPNTTAADIDAMFAAVDALELGDLEEGPSVELLAELGVNEAIAAQLPPVFGGNPLVLKLLARFVEHNEPAEVDELIAEGAKRRTGGAPSGEVGLRFVYQRILERIRPERIRPLAYPGVILRRVTPDLILKVLAPHCGDRLGVADSDDAREAFDLLAGNVWLVRRVSNDTVVHRADTRRLLVPGLEHRTDIDSRAIHRDAARYYSDPPPAIDRFDAEVERIYHLGFLGEIPPDIPSDAAFAIRRSLGTDIMFWDPPQRALLKSLAGLDTELTEEEVSSLDAPRQTRVRGKRIEQRLDRGDAAAAAFEAERLGPAVPDARWRQLFYDGDVEFVVRSVETLRPLARYFSGEGERGSSPTHDYPWYIAASLRLSDRRPPHVFADATVERLLGTGDSELLTYAAAVATLAGDDEAAARLRARWMDEHTSTTTVTLGGADDLLVHQAMLAGADVRDTRASFHLASSRDVRLADLARVARSAGDEALALAVDETAERFATARPDSGEFNKTLERLAAPLQLPGPDALRSVPVMLRFLYGAVRTVMTEIDPGALVETVDLVQRRSVFWPIDLTAERLEGTLRSTAASRELNGIIETADRCGLLVTLLDLLAARSHSPRSQRLATGVRRIELLLAGVAETA